VYRSLGSDRRHEGRGGKEGLESEHCDGFQECCAGQSRTRSVVHSTEQIIEEKTVTSTGTNRK
jgi:hypothetical protein